MNILLALAGILSAVALLVGLWLSVRDSQVHSPAPIIGAGLLVVAFWVAAFATGSIR